MKKIILLAFCAAYTSMNAQISPPSVKNPFTSPQGSKINSRNGTLIEKRTVDLGKFKTLNIQKIITKDLSDNSAENVLGIMIENETYDHISKKTLTIEKPELSKLIQSLEIVHQKESESKRQDDTKYKFVTMSNIEFGSVFSNNSKKWINYIKFPASFYSQDLSEFDKEELKQLITILKSAEEQL